MNVPVSLFLVFFTLLYGLMCFYVYRRVAFGLRRRTQIVCELWRLGCFGSFFAVVAPRLGRKSGDHWRLVAGMADLFCTIPAAVRGGVLIFKAPGGDG